jgi:hypothetical protein
VERCETGVISLMQAGEGVRKGRWHQLMAHGISWHYLVVVCKWKTLNVVGAGKGGEEVHAW